MHTHARTHARTHIPVVYADGPHSESRESEDVREGIGVEAQTGDSDRDEGDEGDKVKLETVEWAEFQVAVGKERPEVLHLDAVVTEH
jgi:hypothetical protein